MAYRNPRQQAKDLNSKARTYAEWFRILSTLGVINREGVLTEHSRGKQSTQTPKLKTLNPKP